jgi:NAD-dependent deacetylase
MVPLTKIGPGGEFPPLRIGPGERVFVLTGAGISAESGVATFRDAGGLWERHRIEDVATPEGFARDPRLVWRFYSERRKQAGAVQPNPAHLALARLGRRLGPAAGGGLGPTLVAVTEGVKSVLPGRLFLCTQNVDPLHEKAGSTGVAHMHGELLRTRCESCDRPPFPDESLHLEGVPRCDCGARLRPHVVWFGEVPLGLPEIFEALNDCDLFVTVGSSGAVYPAAGFVSHLRNVPNVRGQFARCVYVGLEKPENAHSFDECRLGKAGDLLPTLFEIAPAS